MLPVLAAGALSGGDLPGASSGFCLRADRLRLVGEGDGQVGGFPQEGRGTWSELRDRSRGI